MPSVRRAGGATSGGISSSSVSEPSPASSEALVDRLAAGAAEAGDDSCARMRLLLLRDGEEAGAAEAAMREVRSFAMLSCTLPPPPVRHSDNSDAVRPVLRVAAAAGE
jgi:hypothetical protein